MARKDKLSDTLADAVQIGRENAALLPEIRNWCQHLVLKDESAGLVAELYRLPITTSISCLHADSQLTGTNLNWIAGDFILQNCIGCEFHQSVSEPNFGTRLLEEKKRRDEAAVLELDNKNQTNRLLREQIEALINKSKSHAQITELSILQMVDRLNDETEKETNAVQIYEVSKMDPEFFTPLLLEALSLHFEDEKIGGFCIKAVNQVLNTLSTFPDIVYQQAIKALKAGRHLNEVALLFRFHINAENIQGQKEMMILLLDQITYDDLMARDFEQQPNNDGCVDAIEYLIGLDRALIQTLFRQRLGSQDTLARINTNYFLQELLSSDHSFVSDLTPYLIQSFELIDNASFDSADVACAITLGKIIIRSPLAVYSVVKDGISRLTSSGRIGAIRMYRYLFNDSHFINANIAFCQKLVKDLMEMAMNNTEEKELRKACISELHRLRNENIYLLEPSFDAFLGWLSQITEQEKTLLWWLEEIKTKKTEELTTYNPLLGRTYPDIQRDRNRLSNEIFNIVEILSEILRSDKGAHLKTIRQILEGLDSLKQTRLKTILIRLISKSVEDSFMMASFIPSLYTYLFDPQEVKVREEAMKFLERLIDKQPQLITQTFLDIAELFLKDPQVVVRGLAIEIQATIISKIPDKFNTANLDILINSMVDQYAYVHKKSALNSTEFFPHMNRQQRLSTIMNLMTLVEHYGEKDTSFFLDALKNLLFISREFPQIFNSVVKRYLIPACKSNDYYFGKDSLDLLGEIKMEKREFEDDWLNIVIELFSKIQPGFRTDMDWRSDLYNEMYSLSFDCMQRNLTRITDFLNSRTADSMFDIRSMLPILAYFEFHEVIVKYVTNMNTRISKVKSTEGLFRHTSILEYFSAYEESVKTGQPQLSHLKKIRRELQEDES